MNNYSAKVLKELEELETEYGENLTTYDICTHKYLSEDFIIEFQDELDWFWISMDQKLSEEFIREFQDKKNCLYNILNYQDISNEFMYKINELL